MRYIDRPSVQTQFLIFNLFGDYVRPRGGAVRTRGLLEVLGVLGVSERAARSTLSRMKRKGWIVSQRDGRRSIYHLTSKGKALLDEGSRRLFGPRPDHWDGRWHIVTYSLPREKRASRHLLRTRLSWLGYGMLQPGTMIAAYPGREEVKALIEELGIGPYVHFFTGAFQESADPHEIVSRCWDLPKLNRAYLDFIEQHRPAYEAFLAQYQLKGLLPAEVSFEHRFWATYEFTRFPREDPNLPGQLLPPNWRGDEAFELVTRYRALLKEPAEAYIQTTLALEPFDPPRHDEDAKGYWERAEQEAEAHAV